MRLLYHPNQKDISLAGVLYALGDPVRLEIVRCLAEKGELPCAALDCDVPKSTMSHHLRVLREAGVLRCRKEGTQHINSLRQSDLDSLFPGLLEVVLRSMRPPALDGLPDAVATSLSIGANP
ncbi:MAG: ArsR/SmtB family transcription factor [Leptolyngbya sp. IPPAS B-1204]|uniref:Helix-turn-helix transcriptional regulator n=1 Tax=Leptolyngbya sp. NK1-12 TaxID=2547451 RepID=A0AA97AH17_9CYAN|nr:metalloregulator ArsR/SmtB family transcription factor [Leptolyngbya sp. NK1-12]MBF2050361.1 helix-turn-helix transcriptional regulator [Elainella sp. C42_A2020_010]RNJ67152.1 MAG: ArsR family transcriptional regulator [Leptolyngbya sp. IPPAS B-1204]WNZ24945.1 helix-turn-helix transcriptional regulator [Leptolyngbya sp. NK1-12]